MLETTMPLKHSSHEGAENSLAQLSSLAGQRFPSSLDATEAVLSTISDLLGMRTSWVAEINFASNKLVIGAAHNEPGGCDVQPGAQAPLFDTFCSMAAAVAKPAPLIVGDVRNDKRFANGRAAHAFPNIGSYIGVPIILSDATVYGTLCASDPDPHSISIQQVELVTILSRLLASQIERDIELAARLEAERRNRLLASIVESSQDAIYGRTLDGIVTSWNLAAERLYQYLASEMIGQSLSRLLPPNEPNEIVKLGKRVSRGEYIEGYETRRQAKDGRTVDVALTISPIRDSEGLIVGSSTIARDITERKRLIEERDLLYTELQTEVTRTAEIQAHLLPRKAPNLPGFDFAAACLPAREVGGDFFDWSTGGNQVRLSLGDVTGKGMPAALLMATARAALRSVSALPVGEALTTVNRALGPDLEHSAAFVTLFHAELELDGRLTYADAGHGMAMILRQDNFVEPLRQRSLPIGILPETRYSASSTWLEPGDTLIIYSDGLPDARPDLSLNEPADIAELCVGAQNVHQLLDRLVDLAKDSGPRPDDLTVICVRRERNNS